MVRVTLPATLVSRPHIYQFKQHMDYFHCFEIHFLIYFVTVWAHTRAKVSNIWISTAVFFVGGLKQGIGKFARCKLQKKNPVQFMLFSRALTFSRGKTCKKVRAKGIATYVRGTEEWPGTFL